ncbi:MAG: hypothetical protein IJX91_05365 [Clostridia bacterium]|nr:hypothetical protein [Clostridia bacterium]
MKKIKIEPKLSGLSFVEAKVPTPYGVISVQHTLLKNGEVHTDVGKPKEIVIE